MYSTSEATTRASEVSRLEEEIRNVRATEGRVGRYERGKNEREKENERRRERERRRKEQKTRGQSKKGARSGVNGR